MCVHVHVCVCAVHMCTRMCMCVVGVVEDKNSHPYPVCDEEQVMASEAFWKPHPWFLGGMGPFLAKAETKVCFSFLKAETGFPSI